MSCDFLIFDFETVSNIPAEAPIISMGAIAGNWGNSVKELRSSGFYRVVSIKEQLKLGLKPSADTIKWWSEQSREAQEIFKAKNKVTVYQCFEDFHAWCLDIGITNKTKTFIRAPHFDIVIYNNIMSKIHNSQKFPIPYNHWKVRDIRTAIDIMYGVDSGYAPNKDELLSEYNLISHNALEDCLRDYLQLNQYFEAMKV